MCTLCSLFILLFKLCFCPQDRDTLSLKLEDTENWLYEDGEDQPKQVYIDKLDELKVTGLWIRLELNILGLL